MILVVLLQLVVQNLTKVLFTTDKANMEPWLPGLTTTFVELISCTPSKVDAPAKKKS
jgi:hypothetical protein